MKAQFDDKLVSGLGTAMSDSYQPFTSRSSLLRPTSGLVMADRACSFPSLFSSFPYQEPGRRSLRTGDAGGGGNRSVARRPSPPCAFPVLPWYRGNETSVFLRHKPLVVLGSHVPGGRAYGDMLKSGLATAQPRTRSLLKGTVLGRASTYPRPHPASRASRGVVGPGVTTFLGRNLRTCDGLRIPCLGSLIASQLPPRSSSSARMPAGPISRSSAGEPLDLRQRIGMSLGLPQHGQTSRSLEMPWNPTVAHRLAGPIK
jgi:hypothetical protein